MGGGGEIGRADGRNDRLRQLKLKRCDQKIDVGNRRHAVP
jgi:hypothetical protein